MVIASRVAGLSFIKLVTKKLLKTLPRPRQVAPPRKKVALIIGINYEGNKSWGLTGPQVDVKLVRELLIDTFHFSEENIIVLSDEEGTCNDFLPTYLNIMREVGRFVTRAQSNVDYFFVYSGHSNQREEVLAAGELPVERDGQEEYIIPSDALADSEIFTVNQELIISDKKLNECLVRRLGKGCQLVALFDSCHSGTLLNLRHIRCNRVGDLMSLIQNSARRVLVDPLYVRLLKQGTPVSGGAAPGTLRKSATHMSTMSRDSTMRPSLTQECLGFCPRIRRAGKAQVVCFSACKDSQATIEAPSGGGTMITSIVELLRGNPNPSYRQVMLAARRGTDEVKGEMQNKFHDHLKNKPCHRFIPFHRFCLTDEEKIFRHMARSKSEPQLSSLRPLHTKSLLRICDRHEKKPS